MRLLLATMQYARGYGQGTERYVSILAEGLRARGHDVTILAGDPERRTPDLRLGDEVPGAPGVLHYPSTGLLTTIGVPADDLRPLLDRFRPDIVHVANPAHIGIGLLQAADRAGILTVATMMDYWWLCPKHTLQHYQRGICDGDVTWRECVACISAGSAHGLVRAMTKLPVIRESLLPDAFFRRAVALGLPQQEVPAWQNRRAILGEVLAGVDAVIAPSQAARTRLRGHIAPDRIHAIAYGLESRWFESPQSARTLPARPDDAIIGYAGALAQHKGVHLILSALHRLGWTRTRCRIAGTGEPAYLAQLQQAAQGLNVEFVGRIESRDMPAFLAGIDVLVVPSLWPENLPIIILESLAIGTPVLGSDVDGIAASVPNAQHRFPVGDDAGLARCLDAWIKNPSTARAAFRPIAADEMVSRTASVYEQLLSRRTPRRHLADEPLAPPTVQRRHRAIPLTPRVSFIVPCFNHGEFLTAAVESALAQTYQNIEVVIVDDGSTGAATIGVLRHLEQRGIRVIRTPRSGPSAARNTGIRATTSAFFVPLDADDLVMPTFVEQLLPPLLADETLGYCYSHVERFGAWSGVWKCPSYDPRRLLVENLSVVTAVVRRDAFDAVGGYSPELARGFEDWEFWIALLAAGYPGFCVPQTLFRYRKHASPSVTSIAEVHRSDTVRTIISRHRRLYSAHLGPCPTLTDNEIEGLGHAVEAELRLNSILDSRAWRWISAVCDNPILRGLIGGPGAAAPPTLSPERRLAAVRSSPAYRLILALKKSPLYRSIGQNP